MRVHIQTVYAVTSQAKKLYQKEGVLELLMRVIIGNVFLKPIFRQIEQSRATFCFPHCVGRQKKKDKLITSRKLPETDEASDRVTSVMLIHADGFGVQMPFSALSLSQETGQPFAFPFISTTFPLVLCDSELLTGFIFTFFF